ncbi:MAG: anti-sigma-factor antagonist [Actinomycetia bacterium]|nr:anti-sigma-factor antagonist [Actinomycetes bacterium]
MIAVAGDVDMATAPELHARLCDAIDAGTGEAGRVLVADLSQVTFMDASGLTALLRCEAHACGARLQLAAPHPRVARLLCITGLDRHFEVCPPEPVTKFLPSADQGLEQRAYRHPAMEPAETG